ncbi:YdaU family protein [Methylobacterium sp. V23]|uniref:YdaU family protein n=1 Tax=Methylobacterium sp. V23 TaxID=2044878 RepID=UPI0015E17A93|nr:YdaU family protein [Methylobacterium sp. V23]
MVGFYKHDIPAWMDGTEKLSDSAYRAYHVVVQLIMLNEGPIALNERGLSGRCNMTVKAFGRALTELVAVGKVTLEDGRIHNARADRELESVMKNRENAGKGGKTRAIRAETQKNIPDQTPKPLKTNDASEAPPETTSSLKEKRREDSPIVPKGTDRFEEFRAAYPPRNVRFQATPARKRWLEALKRGADPDQIIAGAKSYAAEQVQIGKAGTEFVKTPEVWLRNQLWNDYQPEPAAADGRPAGPDSYLASLSDDDWRSHLRRWRSTGGQWTLANRTRPPDDPDTKVPAHLLAELGDVGRLARAE